MSKKLRRIPRQKIAKIQKTRLSVEALESRLAPSTDVLTYHNDNFLSGDNLTETQLTSGNVNSTQFGKLFSYSVDGYVYAQPLYKSNLAIPGRGTHNVVFVATEHNSVYAFDANNPTGTGGLIWQRNLGPSVPQGDVISRDIVPEIGITGTPVIDATSNTLFVVAKTKETVGGTAHYIQRLHALDIATGNERSNSPVLLGDTTGGNTNNSPIHVSGTGIGSIGGTLTFNAIWANQRTALSLINGVIYIAWASHGDNGPYHGWLVGYQASNLQLVRVYCDSPNGSAGGIWQSGAGIAADAQGYLYLATGNGDFDGGGPGGPVQLGENGGGLGYTGITQSVAVKFDAYKPFGNHSSTGLYVNGHRPNNAPDIQPGDTWVDLVGTGIDFNAGAQANPVHTFSATLNYDGTHLSETITDLTANRTYSPAPYTINIPANTGSSTAYVGFTGGTGGLTTQQSILTWTYGNGGAPAIDHSGGFGSHGDLTANGSAAFQSGAAQLTGAVQGAAGSFFSNVRVDVTHFTTTFTFQMRPGTNPIADGFTFTIQDTPGGATEYGDSVLKLTSSGALAVADSFTPWNQATLDRNDADLGSGGTMLLPDSVGSNAHRHLMVETGKEGKIYLIDRDNLGGYQRGGPMNDDVVQVLQLGPSGVWGNPAYLQINSTTGLIYYQGSGDVMKAFTISNGVLSGPTLLSRTTFLFPGSQPTISANGTSNAIAWAVQVDAFGTGGPAVLHAYNAQNLSQEIYNSAQSGQRDQIAAAVKFAVPTIADGQVFVGAQGSLAVFGLFPTSSQPPAAPSNLAGVGISDTQIQLTWINHATNASGIKIERSTDGSHFTQIAVISPSLTSFTDSGLSGSSSYYYRIRATNNAGDSAYSNTILVATGLAAPLLTIVDVTSSQVDLSWNRVANDDHYDIERSDDGGASFHVVASVPSYVGAFHDANLGQQTYVYRVRALGTTSGQMSLSSPTAANVGLFLIDHSAGFASAPDLTANGSAQFADTTARLTNNYGQAGSVFSKTRVDIRGFSTTFSIRLHEGTQPNPADGLTFTIQADDRGPAALGINGGSLGYQGILHSVAIKFDVYDNEGETSNATGIYFNGSYPGLAHNPGEVNVPIDPNIVNLRDQHTKQIDLEYDGSQLVVTITDMSTGNSVSQTYTVDIPGQIGSDTAYVGFTGGTGGYYSLQDILTWQFQSTDPLPVAPTNLRLTNLIGRQVDLAWTANSANEAGFVIERSANGVDFSPIATVGPNTTNFVDPNRLTGFSTYRVFAFNAYGDSLESNIAQVNPIGAFPFHLDIGSVGRTGNTSYSGGAYTVQASGDDIWNNADAFRFIGQPFTGDGEIVARVVGVQNTDPWAKAGVMIRSSLAPAAANVLMAITPRNLGFFQARLTPGASSAGIPTDPGTATPPYWVRLTRAGNVLTGYISPDGMTWTQVGTVTLDLGNNVYIGLAVTAHNNGAVNTSVLDNVRVTQTAQPMNLLGVTALPETIAGSSFTLAVTARDAFNNRAMSYQGTVQFYSSDPQAMLPISYTFTPGDAGSQTFTVSLATAGVQTITAVDAATGIIMGVATIIVDPGQATWFYVAGFPSPILAGTQGTFAVYAVDTYGNVATSYIGTVHLTSSDPQAVLDGNYTFSPSDGGVAYFHATLYTLGFQSIYATDVNTGIAGEQDGIEVDGGTAPGATGNLSVAVQPWAQGATGSLSARAEASEHWRTSRQWHPLYFTGTPEPGATGGLSAREGALHSPLTSGALVGDEAWLGSRRGDLFDNPLDYRLLAEIV